MKKTAKTKRLVSAEAIARLAETGQDVSGYFTNTGKMMAPLNSLAVDLNEQMIEQLNKTAKKLNVTRQTLIKRFIRRGLEEHSLAQKTRKAG